ncbi:probable methyltransferase PMT24 [Phoenix dactylifera]|uniref:Probable methyltransferase PMT24 n=1 Tax=Phoenix dactylifera TaxID=42345 RepID=A0A8B7D2U6_PHODC|nr:probable methyltransferase PMT24 [Phoenix dactylifera]
MPGLGKNSRVGKRSSPSSAGSTSYYVTIVISVALCILGVWMLTSSSVIPSHTTAATRHRAAFATSTASKSSPSRVSRRDPPPVLEDGPEDGNKDDDKLEPKITTVTSMEDGEEMDRGGGDGEKEVDEDSRSSEGGHEAKGSHLEEQQNEEREEANRSHQREYQREQMGGNEENQEQQSQVSNEGDGKKRGDQQLENHNPEAVIEERQQSELQQNRDEIHEQQQREHDEQLPESGDEENQQEFQEQQQQTESGSNENQQKGQPEIDENHDQIQQKIDQENDESQVQSDEKTGEGTEQSQQQSEEIMDGTEENKPQSGENEEEGTNKNQSQPEERTKDGANESQLQIEEQSEIERSSESQEEIPQQQINEENPISSSDSNASESLDGAQSEVSNEKNGETRPWATQADHSDTEKERRKGEELQSNGGGGDQEGHIEWKLCDITAGTDYIPCLDNKKAIKKLHSFRHFQHRERHCPEEGPTCLVPLPKGYRRPIKWPESRDRIWYNNVPHTKLAEVKGHQNWVKVTGEHLTFPGGGTQFIHGALHYIDFIQQSVPHIAWGKHTHVVLDVGCGVASFGGYLFERDVLTMSFAPKDEHEAQVQMALERGIPAISAVMGSQRLPFPSKVFDLVHCARCRVPWHADGGTLLLELNRVLRPGGYFVWSATPVYQKLKEDVEIWKAMSSLTISMCWDLFTIKKDRLNSVAAAIYRKPISNECYDNRKHHSPPMCKEDDDPNAAWYIPLKACMHRVPVDASERGSQWPEQWPQRLQAPPYWLNSSQTGVYGKPAHNDFTSDYEHWKRVVEKSYINGFGIDWSQVRNVMDMRAVYGGFAAALKDLNVWVMNVVNMDSPDTLPIIYERGLFGIYHDWCESFSTYPRSYDLLHADHLFSQINKRCEIMPVIAEVDRILRPGGKLIVRDESAVVSKVENLLKSLHWEVRLTFSKNKEGILWAEKLDWRP